jgi:hypothetical protein
MRRWAFPAGGIAGGAAEAGAGVAASRLRSDSSVRALASSIWSCSIGRSPCSGCGGTGSRRRRTGGVGEVGGWVWDGKSRRVGMSAESRAGGSGCSWLRRWRWVGRACEGGRGGRASESFASKSLASETLASETLVSENLASEALASESLVSETLASENLPNLPGEDRSWGAKEWRGPRFTYGPLIGV